MYFTQQELKEFVLQQKKIFDIVRLVDEGQNNQYLVSDEGKIVKQPYKCYDVWNRNKKCDNCISQKTFLTKSKNTKFEFIKDDIFFIISLYAEVEGTPYSVELVMKFNEDTMFNAYGRNQFINAIQTYNKKLYIDNLTNAFNRRYLDECLRFKSDIQCIVMVDTDNFKQINDTYGHTVGDNVLRLVVSEMEKSLTKENCVVRYGGDEFLLVIKTADKKDMYNKLDILRQNISSISICGCDNLSVTVSLGAVVADKNAINLIDLADKALYKAKKEKNKVVVIEYI